MPRAMMTITVIIPDLDEAIENAIDWADENDVDYNDDDAMLLADYWRDDEDAEGFQDDIAIVVGKI